MKSFDQKSLTGAQLRAARALLGISAQQLAEMTRLGVATIRRAEQEDGVVAMTSANAQRVIDELEKAGVELLSENGGGAGVRFHRRS